MIHFLLMQPLNWRYRPRGSFFPSHWGDTAKTSGFILRKFSRPHYVMISLTTPYLRFLHNTPFKQPKILFRTFCCLTLKHGAYTDQSAKRLWRKKNNVKMRKLTTRLGSKTTLKLSKTTQGAQDHSQIGPV